MYWQITEIKRKEAQPAEETAGRFVLHQHRDEGGAHFDLRLETGDCLSGWRVAGETFETGCWATEKLPHPAAWLEQDRDARREQDGAYAWRYRDAQRCCVALTSGDETTEVTLERCPGPSVEEVRALTAMASERGLAFAALPGLVEDGLTARTRAVERFCGLSRALDGDGFDEAGWRRLLGEMRLAEIGARLAKVELRHDRAHPPLPVSRPEPLDPEADAARTRTRQAFRIAAE